MKSFRRDIAITLLLKILLLALLWYVCFSGPRARQLSPNEWFFGSQHTHQNLLPKVNHSLVFKTLI